ncbi:hypothetical protein KIPB_013878, partial [Kipferlia bialata]
EYDMARDQYQRALQDTSTELPVLCRYDILCR